MSRPFSRTLHPFDVAHYPCFEPEVKSAVLASWASRGAAQDNGRDSSRSGASQEQSRPHS
jgi:hypothetical protein